jgi:hypothetical protein
MTDFKCKCGSTDKAFQRRLCKKCARLEQIEHSKASQKKIRSKKKRPDELKGFDEGLSSKFLTMKL